MSTLSNIYEKNKIKQILLMIITNTSKAFEIIQPHSAKIRMAGKTHWVTKKLHSNGETCSKVSVL